METKVTYHPEIQKSLDEVEKQRDKIINYQPVMDIAAQLIAEFEKTENTEDWRLCFGNGNGSLNGVLIHVEVTDLEALTGARRWIREHGFGAPTVSDYEAIGRRSWTYKDDNERFVVLSGFFPVPGWKEGDGAKCSFVKVGVKEEPVYELQCNGKPVEQEQADATG